METYHSRYEAPISAEKEGNDAEQWRNMAAIATAATDCVISL